MGYSWERRHERKRTRRHQAEPGLGDFSRSLEAGTEAEYPINFSKTARETNPGKETSEIHSPGSATWEMFKVQIWSQANLDASFSHFYSMIWSHLFCNLGILNSENVTAKYLL